MTWKEAKDAWTKCPSCGLLSDYGQICPKCFKEQKKFEKLLKRIDDKKNEEEHKRNLKLRAQEINIKINKFENVNSILTIEKDDAFLKLKYELSHYIDEFIFEYYSKKYAKEQEEIVNNLGVNVFAFYELLNKDFPDIEPSNVHIDLYHEPKKDESPTILEMRKIGHYYNLLKEALLSLKTRLTLFHSFNEVELDAVGFYNLIVDVKCKVLALGRAMSIPMLSTVNYGAITTTYLFPKKIQELKETLKKENIPLDDLIIELVQVIGYPKEVKFLPTINVDKKLLDYIKKDISYIEQNVLEINKDLSTNVVSSLRRKKVLQRLEEFSNIFIESLVGYGSKEKSIYDTSSITDFFNNRDQERKKRAEAEENLYKVLSWVKIALLFSLLFFISPSFLQNQGNYVFVLLFVSYFLGSNIIFIPIKINGKTKKI